MHKVFFTMLLIAGCSQSVTPPTTEEAIPVKTPSLEEANAPVETPLETVKSPFAEVLRSDALVSATHTNTWPGKPPLAIHSFDVTVKNPKDEPRWIVFPETFPYEGRNDPYPGDGDLAELQLFELSKKPKVIISKGVGSTFWAVKLKGGATLTIEDLKIDSWWDKYPKRVNLEILVATDITVDGKPMESLYGYEPTSDGGKVKGAKSAADPRAGKFWHPADNKMDAKLKIKVESKSTKTVPLEGR